MMKPGASEKRESGLNESESALKRRSIDFGKYHTCKVDS
jgi:hypothetical protein